MPSPKKSDYTDYENKIIRNDTKTIIRIHNGDHLYGTLMKIEYSKFDEIFETKTNFYLMIAKNQGNMLPKSDMPSGLEEFIRNIKL